jgi:BarA-like signal transduction histidine kinase
VAGARRQPPPPARVLWVDDNMTNNASVISQLTETGVKVIQSSSMPTRWPS